jgi:hypothetical protein
MMPAMSVCPACKAEGHVEGAPCERCGKISSALPELELDIPKPPPPKPKAPPKAQQVEAPIEFAVDMNDVRPMSGSIAPGGVSFPPPNRPGVSNRPGAVEHGYAPMAAASSGQGRTLHMQGASGAPIAFESDEEIAARTLAGYGDPPTNALTAPFYAYRVFKRQKELKSALAGRREEATLAANRAEDAMVALGERVRPLAAGDPQSGRTLDELKRAEELMRSRDHSLAREQDAHAERLRSIDLRIAGVEAELVAVQAAERKVAGDLADAQSALQRAEARHKRAEIELRNQAAARERQTKVGR